MGVPSPVPAPLATPRCRWPLVALLGSACTLGWSTPLRPPLAPEPGDEAEVAPAPPVLELRAAQGDQGDGFALVGGPLTAPVTVPRWLDFPDDPDDKCALSVETAVLERPGGRVYISQHSPRCGGEVCKIYLPSTGDWIVPTAGCISPSFGLHFRLHPLGGDRVQITSDAEGMGQIQVVDWTPHGGQRDLLVLDAGHTGTAEITPQGTGLHIRATWDLLAQQTDLFAPAQPPRDFSWTLAHGVRPAGVALEDSAIEGHWDGERWVFRTQAGEVPAEAVPFDNGPDDFALGLARIQAEGKMGFIEPGGRVAVAPRFDFLGPLQDGLADVCRGCRPEGEEHPRMVGGRWGVIGRTGDWVLGPVLAAPLDRQDAPGMLRQTARNERWLALERDGVECTAVDLIDLQTGRLAFSTGCAHAAYYHVVRLPGPGECTLRLVNGEGDNDPRFPAPWTRDVCTGPAHLDASPAPQ